MLLKHLNLKLVVNLKNILTKKKLRVQFLKPKILKNQDKMDIKFLIYVHFLLFFDMLMFVFVFLKDLVFLKKLEKSYHILKNK